LVQEPGPRRPLAQLNWLTFIVRRSIYRSLAVKKDARFEGLSGREADGVGIAHRPDLRLSKSIESLTRFQHCDTPSIIVADRGIPLLRDHASPSIVAAGLVIGDRVKGTIQAKRIKLNNSAIVEAAIVIPLSASSKAINSSNNPKQALMRDSFATR
jgi:hypothetical protein